jgi:hypothetical protein
MPVNRYSNTPLPINGRSGNVGPSPLRAPIPQSAGGNVPGGLPPSWQVLLSKNPTPDYMRIEGQVDTKCRGLAAELFGAARNGADSDRAQRLVEMLQFSMEALKIGWTAGGLRDSMEYWERRREDVMEGPSGTSAPAQSADSGPTPSDGVRVEDRSGQEADKDAEGSDMDIEDGGKGKGKETN